MTESTDVKLTVREAVDNEGIRRGIARVGGCA